MLCPHFLKNTFEKTMNFTDSESPNSDWSEEITSDWIKMASSDEPDPFDYINTKLNLFQVIQLYSIYSLLVFSYLHPQCNLWACGFFLISQAISFFKEFFNFQKKGCKMPQATSIFLEIVPLIMHIDWKPPSKTN